MDFLLGLVKVTAVSVALNLAAEKAEEVTAETWYPKAHGYVQIVGLDGMSSVLGCLGVGLAFLSVACGTAMGCGASMIMRRRQTHVFFKTACIGLTVFLGCGITGTVLGSVSTALMAHGLGGVCLMLLILGFTLRHIDNHQQPSVATQGRILIFSAVIFITVQMGVWSGQDIGSKTPKTGLVIILLLPVAVLMGFLAEITAFRKPSSFIVLSIVLLIPLAGVLLGLIIGNYSSETPLFYETFYTMKSLVGTVETLTVVIGVLFGVTSVNLWEADGAEELSLWISFPTAAILYTLDNQHSSLHSLIEWCLGAGGTFGLLLGLAAASGVSLGLVVMSGRGQLWPCAMLVLAVVLADRYYSLSFNYVAVHLVLPFAHELLSCIVSTVEADYRNSLSVLLEAALNFAFLGVVLMGATILGAAGLLTAALGSAGRYGVVLAIFITAGKAIHMVSK